MSEQEGRERFPSIYQDSQRVGEFSSWPDDALQRLFDEYNQFLTRDDLMPRATESAERIILHLTFEIAWRRGYFDKPDSVD